MVKRFLGGDLEKLKAKADRVRLQTVTPWSEPWEGKEERMEGWVVQHQPNLRKANGKPQSREKWPCSDSPTVLSHWLEQRRAG